MAMRPVTRLALFAALLPMLLLGCGDDSSDQEEASHIAWVSIDEPMDKTLLGSGTQSVWVSGRAFISPSYVAHHCVGMGCILGEFDDSYPGVDVSWENASTGASGVTRSRYGTLTSWEHVWSAQIPVNTGPNRIVIRARDPAGEAAEATLVVEVASPVASTRRFLRIASRAPGLFSATKKLWPTLSSGAPSYSLASYPAPRRLLHFARQFKEGASTHRTPGCRTTSCCFHQLG